MKTWVLLMMLNNGTTNHVEQFSSAELCEAGKVQVSQGFSDINVPPRWIASPISLKCVETQ